MSVLLDSIKQLLAPHVEELTTRTGLSGRQILAISAGALTSVYLISNYAKARRRANKYKLPPGPRAWPVIGNALELAYSKLDAPVNFYQMSKKYGPVILLNILGMEFVVLNDLTVIHEAMAEKQDDFANRPVTWSTDLMSMGGQDIICGQYGPTWKFHRQIVHQAVRKMASGKTLEEVIKKSFDKVAAEIQKQEGVIEMKRMMNLLIFDIMASLTFGKEYGLEDPDFKRLMEMVVEGAEAFGSGTPVDFMPSLAYFPLCWPKMKAIKDLMYGFYAIIFDEVAEHRTRFDKDNEVHDLTDCFFEQQLKAEKEDSSKKNILTDKHIALTVYDVFGAGIDTVNHTLSWFLIYMAKYPDVQEKIRKEIEEKWTADIELIHLQSYLPYTHAVLNETMRLETITSIGVPVATTQDTSVGGYDLPKGTVVITNLWALHKGPEYWDEPEKFNPERFLESDGTLKRHAAFMPFGNGRRRCVGEVLAKNELMMLIALLVKKFEFTKPPGKDDFYVKLKITLANAPKEFSLVVTSRD